MRFSPASMLSFLKREPEAQDAFGGEDLFDGEPRETNWGPKIALGLSVVLFLALIGGIGAIVMMGSDAPPVIEGSLADLEVEEDPAEAAATAEATAPAAAPERDAQRRPWLQAAAPTAPAAPATTPTTTPAPAEAMPAPAMPEVKAADVKPAETKAGVMTPPAPAATPPQAAQPAAASPEPAKVEPAPTVTAAAPAPTTPAPATAAPAMPAPEQPNTTAAADETPSMPSLLDPGVAPGAPRLFAVTSEDANPALAGGRPRLAEPSLPPTDKTSVGAPPPRFANLAEMKTVTPTQTPTAHPAKVAVVVHGLGLNQQATETAISKLPPNVTLAFSPYSRNLKKWLEQAKAKGHEVLVEVPMESKQFPSEDPGPLGLLTSLEPKENQDRMEAILKDATGAVGVIDITGGKFRESEPHINEVYAKLQQQSLFYVQGEPGVRVGEATVPTATADVVLDERPFRAAIDARLDYAERLARYQGSAVAVLSPKPVSYERLVLWLDQASKKGVAITPVSQVLIR